MAKTGKTTASSALGLFTAIVTWLTADSTTAGRDWTIVKDYRLDAEPLNRVVIHNTGVSGEEDIYIGLSNEINSDQVSSGLCCKVYRYFDPDAMDFFDTSFGSRDGYGDTHGFVPYWNSTTSYWIWANKQRIIFVIKTQDKYACAYLGMMNRFMPPSEYPYPLLCLTDSMWSTDWVTYVAYNELWNGRGSLYDLERLANQRANLVTMMPEQDSETNNYYPYNKCPGCRAVCLPAGVWSYRWRMIPRQYNSSGTWQTTIYGYGQQQQLYKSGEPIATLPVYIRAHDTSDGSPYDAVLGQLDGVTYCPATYLSPESTLASGHVVFPDINRTQHYSWMAIEDI